MSDVISQENQGLSFPHSTAKSCNLAKPTLEKECRIMGRSLTHLERLVESEGQDTFAWSRAVPAEVLRAVKTRVGHFSPGIFNL